MTADQQPNPFRPPAEGMAPVASWQWYQRPVWPLLPPPPRNGAGNAALVLGLLSVLFCWTFFLSPLTLALGVLAVVLGLVGLANVRGGRATNRVFAHGGLWTGAAGSALSAVLVVLLAGWSADWPTEVRSAAGADFLAGPGQEVAYADGLAVTVAGPREGDPGQLLVIHVTNGGGHTVDLAEGVARAWIGDEAAGVVLLTRSPEELAPGETGSISFRIGGTMAGSAERGPLALDYAPGDGYDFGFWEFELGTGDGGSGSGPDSDESASGEDGVEA
ncbi:DUF4190 domain-containing protein [Streptomyces millisiae]|uniref:DUF4190 domain-containing protein n=1 Tax=Streptomyces millisiae TaxID=3075542 RepID=A0ABU2M0U6_9ACTN|nr:DUF4190 domain-containing protein [Streptomyces sp. DSM 44918]MDT0323484.1 DUF4190 domain-containing protein [Streptomyces sp. DSM 44918]